MKDNALRYLSFVFFCSGASALIFESVWFRLVGLELGNSVYASSVVLAAFMAGLALGSFLIAFHGHKLSNRFVFYAGLEVVIGCSGMALFFAIPFFSSFFNEFFRVSFDNPLILNLLRALISFLTLLMPAMAMGATLPILVTGLNSIERDYGSVLGRLYGWNTFGAVFGVLINELLLIKWMGIWGACVFAGCLNAFAALIVFGYFRGDEYNRPPEPSPEIDQSLFYGISGRYLAVSFLCGFILLGLEVIWCRFLLLFFHGHSLNFAIMLAFVLLGISSGGLAASVLYRKKFKPHGYLFYFILLSGILVVATYGNFLVLLSAFEGHNSWEYASLASFFLMFPVSFLSGLHFTLTGRLLIEKGSSDNASTSLLAMFNTTGAMLGALIAGFVFIPMIAIEISFFLFAAMYVMTAFLLWPAGQSTPGLRLRKYGALVLAVLVLALFPFGLMKNIYINFPTKRFIDNYGEKRVAWVEGVSETIQYLQKDIAGRPYYHRLITNSHPMSATSLNAKRYMKLFAYLPDALIESPRSALLICFGCGTTAKALTESRHLESIDFVDTSSDIVKLSAVIFPDPQSNPIFDPRVRIQIEDGRFYLKTASKQYDIITAEPPPPSFKGIGNLYSQEYFQLVYNRLNDGGIATYWLPVYQLKETESKAIIKGFCDVFEDCSLWTGGGFEWMLMGGKNKQKPADADRFKEQWGHPNGFRELSSIGLIAPEQIPSLFIADGDRLKTWVGNVEPLIDNYPYRLSPVNRNWRDSLPAYHAFFDSSKSWDNFMASPVMDRYFPASIKEGSKIYFSNREVINDLLMGSEMRRSIQMVLLDRCRRDTLLHAYIPWCFDSDAKALDLIKKAVSQSNDPSLFKGEENSLAALAAMSGRYEIAEKLIADYYAQKNSELSWNTISLRMYLLLISGDYKKSMEVGAYYINANPDFSEKRRQQVNTLLQIVNRETP